MALVLGEVTSERLALLTTSTSTITASGVSLPKLARASRVAVQVDTDEVPVADALRSEFRPEALRLALAGGEDYELLFAGPTDIVAAAVGEIPGSAVIGGVMEGSAGKVAYVAGRGEPLSFAVEGWEHLR